MKRRLSRLLEGPFGGAMLRFRERLDPPQSEFRLENIFRTAANETAPIASTCAD